MTQTYQDVINTHGLPTGREEAWRYANLKGLNVASDVATAAVTFEGADVVPVPPIAVEGHTLDAINTALTGTAHKITITEKCDSPITIIHSAIGVSGKAVQSQIIIELAAGAEATILERFEGDAGGQWVNAVMVIAVADGATLHHVRSIAAGEGATHTGSIHVFLEKDATYKGFNLLSGGMMIRNETHTVVGGSGAYAQSDTVALTDTGSTHDTFTTFNHAVPEAESDQLYRSLIAARGSAAFQGKVIVAKDAQLTNADQNCRAILLDRSAEANAKPELEIFADDVKCAHGATVGELDQKAMYYCLARGMSPEAARHTLMEAFVAEMFERIDDDEIRENLLAEARDVMEGLSHD